MHHSIDAINAVVDTRAHPKKEKEVYGIESHLDRVADELKDLMDP